MKKIIFDLDGVLRNQNIVYGKGYSFDPPIWDYKIDGKDLVTIINENPKIILDMPSRDIINITKKLDYFEIWTVQPKLWIPYTLKWIEKYVEWKSFKILFLKSMKEKEYALMRENGVLIDDYPFFNDYKKIIVVDHIYNRNVKECLERVKSKNDLEKVLKRLEFINHISSNGSIPSK